MSGRAALLEQLVIKPVLTSLGIDSPAARQLLLGTAASETDFGEGIGDHIGIYGISSAQHREVWDKHLAFMPELASKVRSLASRDDFLKDPDAELRYNLAYGTAIAWLIYQFNAETIPAEASRESLADCWRRYFHWGEQRGWKLPVAA